MTLIDGLRSIKVARIKKLTHIQDDLLNLFIPNFLLTHQDANKSKVSEYANYVSNGFKMEEEPCTISLNFETRKRMD